MSEEIVDLEYQVINYQHCTGVPFQDIDFCFKEVTMENMDMLMLSISSVVISMVILVIMIGRKI
jgi:hypothetical protein